MTAAMRLGEEAWLGVSLPRRPHDVSGAARRSADVRAARRALAAALGAGRLVEGRCAVSWAHSRGAGAALVGPPGRRLGVDVVQVGRVTVRHAAAMLSRHEWRVLGALTPEMAALGWALKEAGAKATGAPGRYLPFGVAIENDRDGAVEVRARGELRLRLRAGWWRSGAFLFAWVVE